MQNLWAPWRLKYVKGKKKKGCVFCRAAKAKSSDYLVFKTRYSLVLLNIFPYNNGHLIVAPLRHVNDLDKLKDAEIIDLFHSLNAARKKLNKILKPHGYNLGINIGESAGAGIPGHLHMHIVPRWRGDVNFMPVVFHTKVIPQLLCELHKKLKDA